MARYERGRGVAGTALMRRPVIDLDEIISDDRIIGVCLFEITPDAALRYETIEHCRADYRSFHRESSRLVRNSSRPVQSHQPRRRDECDSRKPLVVPCSEDDRVSP